LVMQVFRDKLPPLNPPKDFSFRPFPRSDIFIEQVKLYYATACANQGVFRTMIGDTETGVVFLRKALTIQPDMPAAIAWLDRLVKTN
jgi:hypothetical protein